MNKFIKFFNYNWFKIFKDNFKNNDYSKGNNVNLIKLVFKKEICALIFVILNFLVVYTSSIEVYKMSYTNNIFFYILKDNILVSFIWFLLLSLLPIISLIFFRKKIKKKYYLVFDFIYILSNVFNILLVIYFITCFINNFIISILGIINIIVTVIINCNIILDINEEYLKKLP